MKKKESNKWNEIRTILYTMSIVFGSLGTSTISNTTDSFTVLKGLVFIVVAFTAILFARYVVPPQTNKN